MRIDKNNPWLMYTDFVDWLQKHPVWIVAFFIGYVYYLSSTEEVKRY